MREPITLYYKNYTKPLVIGSLKGIANAESQKYINTRECSQYNDKSFSVPKHDLSVEFGNEPSGFALFRQAVSAHPDDLELFEDSDLKNSTGLHCRLTTTSIEIFSPLVDGVLWQIIFDNNYQPIPDKRTVELYSIYSSSDGSWSGLLNSMLGTEQMWCNNQAPAEVFPPANQCITSCPFFSGVQNSDGNYENLTVVTPTASISPFLSFATLQYIYSGVRPVAVKPMSGSTDGVSLDGKTPCVVYDPRAIDRKTLTKTNVSYDYKTSLKHFYIGLYSSDKYIGSTYWQTSNDTDAKASVGTPPKSVGTNGARIMTPPFIQAGDSLKRPTGNVYTSFNAFGTSLSMFVDRSAPTANFNAYDSNNYSKFYIVQNFSVWNPDKYLHDNASDDFGQRKVSVTLGTSDPVEWKVPFFGIIGGAFDKLFSGHKDAVQRQSQAIPFLYTAGSPTGQNYLDWLYSGKWSDDGPEPDVPTPPTPSDPDVPNDNGNGGFNDSDHLGGGGTWSDTSSDLTYDKNGALWSTPDNIGIDGNYDIVKLNNDAVKMLANQTWTEDNWLSYVMKFSNISRTRDGIINIKTCMADIPTTGNAKISAIAGYGLNQAIPCSRVNQYNIFDMGTVDVPVYFGSFLDYAPYTEITLELPFAHPVKLPPEVVVGKTVSLTLVVDLMSDSGLYIITSGKQLIAQVPANIFINIPFGASEYSESAASGIMSEITNAVGIGGDIGATMAGATVQQKVGTPRQQANAAAKLASTGVNAAIGVAEGVVGVASDAIKHDENRTITQISQGGGAGAIGAMGLKYAVLKISRPYVTIPPRYYELNGAPSGFVKKVGDCTGYLEASAVYGTIPCNSEEFRMITDSLAAGIFP